MIKNYLSKKNIENEILKDKIIDEYIYYIIWIERFWKYIDKNKRRLFIIYITKKLKKMMNDVHKDIDHYETEIIWKEIKNRYYIFDAKKWVKKKLISYISYQLFMISKIISELLYEMNVHDAFIFWNID